MYIYLVFRRMRNDFIQMHKILTGLDKVDVELVSHG